MNTQDKTPPVSIDKEVLEMERFIGKLYIGEKEIASLNMGNMNYPATGDNMCKAYNGTIAKGYNPAAMEELYLSLRAILKVMNEFHGQMPVAFRAERATAEQAIKNAQL